MRTLKKRPDTGGARGNLILAANETRVPTRRRVDIATARPKGRGLNSAEVPLVATAFRALARHIMECAEKGHAGPKAAKSFNRSSKPQ